jgi:hypothetical protein
MQNVWDYVIDGLFVTFLVSIIGGIAASSGAFNSLLYGMFAASTETNLNSINTTQTYKSTLLSNLNTGATTLQTTTQAGGQVYPLAMYIAIFALFIGAVLGIVVYAMSLIASARAVPVPVKAA